MSPSFGPNQGPPNAGHPGNPMNAPHSAPYGNVNPAQGIQVQSKGANTLQYMPMQGQGMPPPEAGGGAGDMGGMPTTPGPNTGGPGGNNYRFELDFMQAFAEPLTNLESKVPQTKLQYFPNSKAGVSSNNSSTITQTGPRMTGPNPSAMGAGGATAGGSGGPGGHGGPGGPGGPMGGGPTGPQMNRPPMNVGPGNGNQMNLQINMQMNQGGPNGGPGGSGPANGSGVAGVGGPGPNPGMGNGGPPAGFGDFQMFQQQLYSTNQGGGNSSNGPANSNMGPPGGGGGASNNASAPIPASSGPGMMGSG